MTNKAEIPLSTKEKLIFFFGSILVRMMTFGTDYKALGYHRKARECWHYIYAGIIFYICVTMIFARVVAMGQ